VRKVVDLLHQVMSIPTHLLTYSLCNKKAERARSLVLPCWVGFVCLRQYLGGTSRYATGAADVDPSVAPPKIVARFGCPVQFEPLCPLFRKAGELLSSTRHPLCAGRLTGAQHPARTQRLPHDGGARLRLLEARDCNPHNRRAPRNSSPNQFSPALPLLEKPAH
jgi:hypothetical protein